MRISHVIGLWGRRGRTGEQKHYLPWKACSGPNTPRIKCSFFNMAEIVLRVLVTNYLSFKKHLTFQTTYTLLFPLANSMLFLKAFSLSNLPGLCCELPLTDRCLFCWTLDFSPFVSACIYSLLVFVYVPISSRCLCCLGLICLILVDYVIGKLHIYLFISISFHPPQDLALCL